MKLWRVLVSTACYSLSLQFLGQIRRFSASALISASHFTGWSAIPWQSKTRVPYSPLYCTGPHYTVLSPLYCAGGTGWKFKSSWMSLFEFPVNLATLHKFILSLFSSLSSLKSRYIICTTPLPSPQFLVLWFSSSLYCYTCPTSTCFSAKHCSLSSM